MTTLQKELPVVLGCRTCDLHHIAVIHSLTMQIYCLQAAAPRLDFGNRPKADLGALVAVATALVE